MKVKIKKLSDEAVLPTKGSKGAAAYDIRLPREVEIKIGRNVIPLDIAIELPQGYEAKIEPRSGFSSRGIDGFIYKVKNKFSSIFNADVLVGKIDSDYRGNIAVIVNNHETMPFYVEKGLRIAQLTIYKVEDADFEEVKELSETERGNGGFGSTGCK